MHVLLIYNPSAGDDGVDPDELVSLLEAEQHSVEAHSTKDESWESALRRGPDIVAVAGGDGAVGKVFKRLGGSGVTATLLPVGSANNIARSLGFRHDDPARLVRGWPQAERRPFEIGALGGSRDETSFVESAGGGIFGETLVRAERVKDEPGGDAKVELGLKLLRTVVEEVPALEWGLEADGTDLSGEFVAVEVMNVRELGPNVPLAPEADPGDGLLELALLRPDDRQALDAHLEARLEERPPAPLAFEVRRARRIMLRPPQGHPLHVDDDVVADDAGTDALVATVSTRLEVLVPP